MATRTLRPRHQEDIKLKIQSSQLVNLLQNHALGNSENELKPSQLKNFNHRAKIMVKRDRLEVLPPQKHI